MDLLGYIPLFMHTLSIRLLTEFCVYFNSSVVTLKLYLQIRLYIEPSKLGDIDNAVSAVPRLLAYYEEFFGIPYPLPKLGKRKREMDCYVKKNVFSIIFISLYPSEWNGTRRIIQP